MTVPSTPILILNWNGWDDTFDCLQSLQELQNTGENLVVWLIDNGSDEDRSAEAATIFPDVRIVPLNQNFGWAGGYNRALQMAHDEGIEFVYLLNNDCRVRPDFLKVALEAARADDKIAAVGSRILFEHPAGFVKFDGAYYQSHSKPFVEQSGLHFVREVNGAGMLVRLKAFAGGGFDERFFCYAEEVEWCRRMAREGWKIAVCLDSLIEHQGQGSDMGGNALYYRVRNQFLLAHSLPPLQRHLRRCELVLRALRQAMRLRHHRDGAQWSALCQGLSDGVRGRFGKRRTP